MSWRRNYAGGKRKPIRTRLGRKVRSKLEARVLDTLDAAGVDYEYEPRTIKWSERITGAKCDECGGKSISKSRRYLPDIILGNDVVLEIKGRFTTRDRKLVVGVRETNVGLDIRMVFDRDNKLSPGSKTRYSDWCNQHGIQYCLKGVIPKEWLEQKTSK